MLQVEISFDGKGEINLSDFVPSGTWDLSSGTAHVSYYLDPSRPNNGPTSKTDVTFNILVRRKVK